MKLRLMDTISTLSRALKILEAFSVKAPALRLTEIASRVNLHTSTVYRLLSVLVAKNYLFFDRNTKQYKLGNKFLTLASIVLSQLDVTDVAKPIMRELVEQTGQTANLAVLDQDSVIYIAKVEPPSSLRISSRIGARVPAHCTALGKVLLSHLPEMELDRLLTGKSLPGYSISTITNPTALKKELKRIKLSGYAIDHEEFLEGLVCVAYPIYDYTNEVIAAISISGPATNFKEKQIEKWIMFLKKSSQAISGQLGYDGMEELIERESKD